MTYAMLSLQYLISNWYSVKMLIFTRQVILQTIEPHQNWSLRLFEKSTKNKVVCKIQLSHLWLTHVDSKIGFFKMSIYPFVQISLQLFTTREIMPFHF